MKARELKELRANNPQDLKVKLNDLKAELFNGYSCKEGFNFIEHFPSRKCGILS